MNEPIVAKIDELGGASGNSSNECRKMLDLRADLDVQGLHARNGAWRLPIQSTRIRQHKKKGPNMSGLSRCRPKASTAID